MDKVIEQLDRIIANSGNTDDVWRVYLSLDEVKQLRQLLATQGNSNG